MDFELVHLRNFQLFHLSAESGVGDAEIFCGLKAIPSGFFKCLQDSLVLVLVR